MIPNANVQSIEPLIREAIRSLKPYRCARHDFSAGILLDANENSLGSPIEYDGVDLNRYPDPLQHLLRSRLAELNNVGVENVLVGVGSDEVIDLIIRIFCEPKEDFICILEPTYGMYRVAADIQGVSIQSIPLTSEFDIDVDKALHQIDPRTKVIFTCSPNNPTGNLLDRDRILELVQALRAIIVVDEAYIDFADADSLATEVSDYQNLIVMRTLSKAWGLAGIRLGYAISHPTVTSYLMKVKAPYNINSLTSRHALRALERRKEMQRTVRILVAERERLAENLRGSRHVERVFCSDSNFLLVRFYDSARVYAALAGQNVIVRDRGSVPQLGNCLRITVGTREQNERLVDILQELEA